MNSITLSSPSGPGPMSRSHFELFKQRQESEVCSIRLMEDLHNKNIFIAEFQNYFNYTSVVIFQIATTRDHFTQLAELCFSQEENWVLYSRSEFSIVTLCCPLELSMRGIILI